MIELNRLSVQIDHTAFESHLNSFILLKSEIPVIHVPFKLELVNLSWEMEEDYSLPVNWRFMMAGEIVNPDWTLRSELEVLMELEINRKIGRWGEEAPLKLSRLYLDDKSRFYVDEHEINLVDTINRIIAQPGLVSNILNSNKLDDYLTKLSKKHFGSDTIRDQLSDLYYQIEGDFQQEKGTLILSAAGDLEHFSEKDLAPTYAFFKIPTDDLVFFVNHFTWPAIDIKGYKLALVSLYVEYDNMLTINVKELKQDWDISLDIRISLRDNILYTEVTDIKAEGLDLLKKTLFKIFKGLLIKQIEKNTVSVTEIYRKIKSDLKMKYPFLQIQPDCLPVLDALSVNVDKTEMMVHFEDNEIK